MKHPKSRVFRISILALLGYPLPHHHIIMAICGVLIMSKFGAIHKWPVSGGTFDTLVGILFVAGLMVGGALRT